VPFTGDLPAGKRRRVVIELRGPRDAQQQKRFKAALQKLLRQNNAAIRPTAKKKPAARRKRK
jgi:hypothetical protein